jgi:flagellar basal body-associated protein FliL
MTTFKSNKIAIFLIAYVVFLGALAFAGYYFYADYKMQTTKRQVLQNDQFQTDMTYIDLPRISVTLSSDRADRSGFVRMDITLEVENKYATKVEGLRARITDSLINYTQTLNYDDLTGPRATSWLKPDLLKEINTRSSPAPIKDIIFRQFVVL